MTVLRRAIPLALAAAAVFALVISIERVERSAAARPAVPLQAFPTLSSRTLLFGEPLVARLALVVDPRRVDPARVRVAAGFTPFRVVGAPSVQRSRRGGLEILRYSYRLECLSAACPPHGPQRAVAFPPAAVRVGGREGRVLWPSLTLDSRLTKADLAAGTLRLPPPSPVSYRLPPRALGIALAVLSGTLLLGAGLAAARLAARRGRSRLGVASPLERALALVLEASARAAEERRIALDRLAVALDQLGVRPLAAATRELAWARPEPEGEAMTELVTAVRKRKDAQRPDRDAGEWSGRGGIGGFPNETARIPVAEDA